MILIKRPEKALLRCGEALEEHELYLPNDDDLDDNDETPPKRTWPLAFLVLAGVLTGCSTLATPVGNSCVGGLPLGLVGQALVCKPLQTGLYARRDGPPAPIVEAGQ